MSNMTVLLRDAAEHVLRRPLSNQNKLTRPRGNRNIFSRKLVFLVLVLVAVVAHFSFIFFDVIRRVDTWLHILFAIVELAFVTAVLFVVVLLIIVIVFLFIAFISFDVLLLNIVARH